MLKCATVMLTESNKALLDPQRVTVSATNQLFVQENASNGEVGCQKYTP